MDKRREGNVEAAAPVSRGRFMDLALEQGAAAGARGEVPVGAVVVRNRTVVAAAGNETRARRDPTAHAEILAIREACRLMDAERLPEADLYVTLEPCAMCAGAISFARIRRLYFGATDAKGGAVVSGPRFFSGTTCHHSPDLYSGIGETESEELLRNFFGSLRGEGG